jgi:putative endopeptidase
MDRLFCVTGLIVLLSSCKTSIPEERLPEGVGIILSNRDTTTRPGDDFFQYANGGWLSRTVIPPDRGVWSSFNELQEHNNKIALEALQKAAVSQDYLEGTDQRKAADFYSVGMDSMLAEKSSASPMKPILDKIDAIASKTDLQNFLVAEDLMAADAFFSVSIYPDLKNSQKMAVYIRSGGIGLPERDYYLKADPKSKEIREKYRQHIGNLLLLSGWDVAKVNKSIDRILLLETALATATITKEESRDPQMQYNKKSVSGIGAIAPSINWSAYFKLLGIHEDSVIVTEPFFLRECERTFTLFPLDDIKSYLRWTIIRRAAPLLSNTFVTESFDFNEHYLLGVDKMSPRRKRVLDVTNTYLGEAVGKLYVAEAFPPEAKKRAQEMVENIKFAFADRIKRLDWMGDSTKKMALKKLSLVTVKIGYPDKWKNYVGLLIEKTGNSYYDLVLNATKFQMRELIGKLGKPPDRTEWGMTPQTVNAYYNSQYNEIVFPAGILQPPFYDFRADEAVNYGGIGAGIGHEISHGFDDEGSQYDAGGNLKNWWRADDLKKFKEKGTALVEQFNKYQPLPGVFVQGQFTLGENIGDLGGLNVAYDGLQRFYRESNARPGLIDGLTPEQRFFMSWATVWRAKYREESLRTQILTNPHAPGMYRANGPLSNMESFYKAFGVKPGDKLYREEKDRVKIW